VVRVVMVLVVVSLEGAIDKHLQALDIAALFMLLKAAGVAHVEETTLLTSSEG
jgi:fructose-1,6-bisphosphatase/inositol monophosphatase family enzyme